MSLELATPDCGVPTGPKLAQKITELGIPCAVRKLRDSEYQPRNITARVLWGAQSLGSEVPELNKHQGHYNKLQALQRFQAADIPIPMYWQSAPRDEDSYPVLARRLIHQEGNDIRLCSNREEAGNADADFFTRVVPSSSEYRIWVYKTKVLGVYLRELYWPVQRAGFGRNWWSGWGFSLVDTEQAGVGAEYAVAAVEALRLDFGGVDVLKGENGRYYVLEVNSAPGANNYCLRARNRLATEIKRWYEEL